MEIKNPEEFRLGQEMLKEGLLTEAQMKTALEYQRSLGGKLQDIIGKLGFVDDKRLNSFIARREHMHTIDVRDRTIDADLMRRIPREVIQRHEVIPFRQSANAILLAMSEPMDYQAIEEMQFLTSCTVETALAPRSQILEAIARFYDEHPDLGVDVSSGAIERATEASEEDELLGEINDPAIAALARLLLKKGIVDVSEWRSELDKQL